jgi:hypothetical protein
MKKILSILLILFCITTLFCSCEKKNYSVKITDGTVNVKMRCPTKGIVGINQVGYEGFTYEEVEETVFDKIRNRDYDGDYTVVVTLEFKDAYGNYYDGPAVTVSHLNGADTKRYASYRYFRGSSNIYKAFPWNYDYH